MSGRSSTRTSAVLLALGVGLVGGAGCNKPARPPIKVAAASDLSAAFGEMGKAFEAKTGQKVVFSFGSTGLLAKQISEGAPFDLFAAADASFTDAAVKSGACLDETKALYARGRIVIWTKKGAFDKPLTLADLRQPRFAKVAIANPEHAPYGRAAKEALMNSGAWDDVSKKVVYGENVLQTLQYAQSGNVEAAIIALSLSMLESSAGDVAAIESSLYAPLDQKLVVCKGAGDGRAFAAYVNSDQGRSIMKQFGFLLPGESVTAR
jgi:molybdate transport system substrate-binding protein